MNNKMWNYIKKHRMIEKNDLIVIGVSGGPDSMCLFHLLLQLQKKTPFVIEVVHVNHMIREEAEQEAIFVKNVCEKYRIPYKIVTTPVIKVAKDKKISIEEAGRIVRYEAFEEMLQERKGKIAIAHNKNDSAETVLFHLFRGTGMQGLCGILPTNGKIIRPLLCFERKEIEMYLKKNQIEFCTDLSNDEDIYTRNKIRRHILPYAEKEVCENIIPHITETAEMIQEAQDFIIKTVAKEKIFTTKEVEEKSILIKKKEFKKLHIAIQTELIREVLFEIAEYKKDISKSHILEILSLFDKQVGKKSILPYQMQALRSYKGVLIEKQKKSNVYFQPIELQVAEMQVSSFGKIAIEIIEENRMDEVIEKKYTKWFDYDKILSKCLILRTRSKGDYLTINKQGNKKSLKDYMINEKISQKERERTFVIADNSHIVWVVGYRISEAYKVTKDTKKMIKIEIIKGS